MFKFIGVLLATGALALPLYAADVGIVTSLTGAVQLHEGKQPGKDIKSFIKLRESDKLSLPKDARVQIVFFESGVQETWTGTGEIQLNATSSELLKGTAHKEQKTLPEVLVKQLVKTPSPERGRAGMLRMRSLNMDADVQTLEKNYADMRQTTPAADKGPEMYVLAGYFELHEYSKLEQHLEKLGQQNPQDADVISLQKLYTQAILQAKSNAK